MITILEKLLELLLSLVESAFGLLGETIETIISGVGKRKHAYTANFISGRDLLARSNTGFCLTGTRSLSAKQSYTNALIVGGTGVGKSSVVLLPSLYKMQGSFIVHDPSGELFQKSAGYLRRKGYDVKVLNFARPEISAGYNPLSRAKSTSDILKIANMLIENALGSGKKDPFWMQQGSSLLALVIEAIQLQAECYRNLYNVRMLLDAMGGNPKAVDLLFARYAKTHPVLWSGYKAFIAYDEKVRSGVIATCQAALTLFADEGVAQVTSTDTLPMDSFRKKPTALFLQTSISDVKYYSILTSLYLEQCFGYVLSRFPEQNEQDIFFLVDEAAALKFSNLQLSIANVRKHRSGIMLLVQDFNQLISNYGKQDAESIRANCFAKMYFTGQPHETSKELEDVLGKFEYKDENNHTVVRPLMTADEIRTMSERRSLILCGHFPAIKAKLRPYYKQSAYRAYSEIAPPKMIGAAFSALAVLPLPAVPKTIPHEKATEE